MISTPTGIARTLDLDLAVVERSFPQHLAQALPGLGLALGGPCVRVRLRARQQLIEHAFLGGVGGAMAHFRDLLLARHLDGDLDKILA